MGRQRKYTKVGRKISIGKRVMKVLRTSEKGITLALLKRTLHNEGNSVFPTESEIKVALKNGLQRGALYKHGKLFKAANPGKSIESTKCNTQKPEKKSTVMQNLPSIVKCVICLEEKRLRYCVKLSCNHIFCMSCMGKWVSIVKTCPICRQCLKGPAFTGILY